MRKIINSKSSLSEAIGILRKTWEENKYLTMTITTGKKRSVMQNANIYGWYKQVSTEEGEYSPEQVRRFCKYHYGVPILRASDLQVKMDNEMIYYDEFCRIVLDQLPYESRIEAMRFYPVTHLMTTKQLKEYELEIQRHYDGRVDLQFPKD